MTTGDHSFGVYVGRFNPLHLAHVHVIKQMLAQFGPENSLLVIGSSNAPISLRHFFTYEERKTFIKKLFPSIRLVGLPDFHDDRLWLSALDDLLTVAGIDPKQATFFGGCMEDLRFFEEDGRHCTIFNRFDGTSAKISATEVRDALIEGRSLDGLIDPQLFDDITLLFKKKWEQFKKI